MLKIEKIVIALMVAILICTTLIIISNNRKKYTKPIEIEVLESYTVAPGDTLWTIATEYKHDDIRRLVYDIQKANDITPVLQIGQELRIPIQGK